MTLTTPIIIAALTAIAVLMMFLGLWLLFRKRDAVDKRLLDYQSEVGLNGHQSDSKDSSQRYKVSPIKSLFMGFGIGPKLATGLMKADIPLTATEYALIIIFLVISGLVIGTWRVHILFGLALAIVLGFLPISVMRVKQRTRLRKFNQQLPDLLTLLVGALRAGFGLTQALELLVERLGPPAADEIARVTQAINLGVPTKRAMEESAARVGSDDYNLVVVAITVQAESGGNLAETLEIIAQTVRHRLHILSEIRVLTSQQRFTGYTLALLPIFAGVALFLINPEYMLKLLEPGITRIVAILALLMQVVGFIVIQRIVDIEV